MSSKRIECYIDCVSPYSFYAFTYLQENRSTLESHGVEIELIPVFLGGINVGSGNKPPWTLPNKAAYSKYDGKRAQRYFGHDFEIPSFFPILSLLPQRALTYIKKTFPKDKFEAAFLSIFRTMWYGHIDVSTPENLAIALSKSSVFIESQVQEVLKGASRPETKSALTTVTDKAVKDLGAFGCPWFWVSDGKGNSEPFFGSDRFHYMWDYLGVPHVDLRLLGKGEDNRVGKEVIERGKL
ncbi:thioredoxin-like protein [Aspergillus karnatakaensis]|uniref:putative DSBA family oxidoreductase n=1 Tax=Aspergillus karnatakaensis TaxID=1810916 RepID=UPI003CCD3131